ncbi:4625_t:CDS:1, partial [Acaulospora morrowiae]
VEKRRPKDQGDLEKIMKEEWDQISEEEINNIIGSMEERCMAIIEKG